MGVPLTIVVAVYNMQQYLPRFVQSLQQQTFKNFEVLFIDDASTDDSAAILDGFSSTDHRIRLLKLEKNMGVGYARNIGIRAVTSETLCFADSDDLLPENSLEVRLAAYKKYNAIVRACHDEIASDGLLINHEVRPDLPEICKPSAVAQRIGPNPFLCAHWTWLYPTGLLQKNNIFHGEDMRTADDIYMLTHLFYHIQRLVWIPDTVYHWIKRADSLSTIRYSSEHYENYFRCCDIFYQESVKNNNIKLADDFYDSYLFTYLSHLLKQVQDGKSTEDDVQHVVRDAARVCTRHKGFERLLADEKYMAFKHPGFFLLWQTLQGTTPSMVQRLASGRLVLSQHQQILHYERIRQQSWDKNVRFDKFDAEQNLVRARYYFCDTHPEEKYTCDSVLNEPAFAKNRSVFTGENYKIFERILWLQLSAKDEDHCSLTVGEQATALNHNVAQIRDAFTPKPLDDRNFPADVRALRHLAQTPTMRERFQNAWMFIDKDTEADDNAEHLYRWILKHHPELNIWFVLKRGSRDWIRLEAEGFRLIAHGEVEHYALFLNCIYLISSQMDQYIFQPVDERYFLDFVNPKFICVPHGVTKDDVSAWFNTIPFDLFIGATRDEVQSISADQTPYVMTEKEVRLGGFPRYDNWLVPVARENIIFIMPTWRADLVGEWDGKGQRRAKNLQFYSSKFARMWKELFDDARMEQLLNNYDYRVVFFAHPCFEDYVEDMPFPNFVEKRSKQHGTMIDIIRKSKIMITDFSSVAYDMAYMRKPVVYYQYESKADFTRSQRWVSGYIDYEQMGFGPVCRNKDDLFATLEKVICSYGVMSEFYQKRAENTFAYHDARCCERAYKYIVCASTR